MHIWEFSYLERVALLSQVICVGLFLGVSGGRGLGEGKAHSICCRGYDEKRRRDLIALGFDSAPGLDPGHFDIFLVFYVVCDCTTLGLRLKDVVHAAEGSQYCTCVRLWSM